MASFGDIRRRIILLFVLGIGLPSALLAYLALRGIRNDQALLEREQREGLTQIASAAIAAYDSSLVALGRSLDSALAQVDSTDDPRGQSWVNPAPLSAFTAGQPLIEATFHLSPDGGVDELLAPDLPFRVREETGGQQPPFDGSGNTAMEAALRLEVLNRDPSDALAAYQGIATGPSEPRVRAGALVAIARIKREQGDFDEASALYRRLGSEFDQARTDGGIPFGLVARLELGRTQAQAGDTASAAATLVGLYSRLVRTDLGLSRGQFGVMTTEVRESLDALLENTEENPGLAALEQRVEELVQKEELARAHGERMLTFQASAGEAWIARGNHESKGDDQGYARSSMELGGYSFYLLLQGPKPSGPEETRGKWGLLLDPDAMESQLAAILREQSASRGIAWSLRGASGEVRASSAEGVALSGEVPDSPVGSGAGPSPREDGDVVVSRPLPGAFPPLTIELSQPDGGFIRTLLTSRRGVFFYGFLLLAGILAFGLTLTVVTVSHQLALARMQSDFVSTVSHEFKSPLTAIRQIAEMLHSGKAPSEDRRQRYYDLLLEQSERLSILIDRVLDFARMDSGQQAFRFQPVVVSEFVVDAVAQAQQRFGSTGFDIQSEIPPELPTVPIDADALRQAVANLIDNAVKYSGSSRKVIVRAFVEGGDVAIAVQDFGIGLDPKEKARVFERFYRGGDALTRSVKGTGLGLTLVKQIVEGHGGQVAGESEPERGSTFTIRIPAEGAGP